MITSVLDAAKRAIQEHEMMALSVSDRDLFTNTTTSLFPGLLPSPLSGNGGDRFPL